MSDLPEGWTTCLLGSVAEIKLGKMLDKAKNEGPLRSYLRNVNVRWFGFDLSDLAQMRMSDVEAKLFDVRDDDVLVCEGGEPGRGAVWNLGDRQLTYQKALHRVRVQPALLPKMLVWQLRLDSLSFKLDRYFTGSTIKHFPLIALQRYPVSVPPLAEQKRIADKLDTVLTRVDAVSARLARVAPILKRFRQSVLAAATSGRLTKDWRFVSGHPFEWQCVALGEVARDFSYGSAAKSLKEGAVPVLRMGNIRDGKLDWEDLVFTSDPSEISKYELAAGDVLFNRTNSPDLVGKAAVFAGERKAIYAGYLIRVRCNESLLPAYLTFCLGSPAGRDYCWTVKSDGVSQSNINAKKLAAFKFELPPLDEQAEIVRRVETLFAFADRLEARLKSTQTATGRLTPALLAKAFRGELVPQDPDDEPASELLRRLQAAAPARAVGRGRKRSI